MRICLMTEGSYPYVVGGVSSWVQMMIEGFPEHEFIVYSIGAEAKDRGKFKYKFPPNMKGIQEAFLDSILDLKSPGMKGNILSPYEVDCLYNVVSGEKDIDLDALVYVFSNTQQERDALDVFMSEDFFNIVESVYKRKYSYLPFTDFFWTLRSMLLPMFYMLQQPLPDADLYHSVATGYCGIMGSIASKVKKKPFILTEHGIYSRERETEIIKCSWAEGDFKSVWIQYFYNICKLAYNYADKVVTLFEANAQIEQELGCDPDKISIVPNGVKMERFAGIPELQPPNDHLVIGGVVRVVPIKDVITMLRAFLLVQQVFPDAELLVIGPYAEDPEYYDMCLQTVKTLKLRNVTFTGSVNVVEFLPKLDICLLSSISEGQPLSVLEGMAARRPFVTTNVGCCKELIYGRTGDDLGDVGAVVPPMDYEGMAREIIKLGRDFDLRKKMGNIGYERVKRYYTYDGFIAGYREIYDYYAKGHLKWQA